MRFLFPADAGMYRNERAIRNVSAAVPRRRGDVPTSSTACLVELVCSPQTRGCTGLANSIAHRLILFPADAGMYRVFDYRLRPQPAVPRRRGDVPSDEPITDRVRRCSPQTRG